MHTGQLRHEAIKWAFSIYIYMSMSVIASLCILACHHHHCHQDERKVVEMLKASGVPQTVTVTGKTLSHSHSVTL
jgi:hypothetical protein